MKRKFTDVIVRGLAFSGLLLSLLLAVGLLGWIFIKGLGAIDWAFITESTQAAGASGGIFFQIVGTIFLIGSALLIAVPFAIGLALWRTVYGFSLRLKTVLDHILQWANAMPSIVFGVLGYLLFFEVMEWGKSWLAGGVVLAMMILPGITLTLVKGIEAIPVEQTRAALGLGLRLPHLVAAVILPQCRNQLITGTMIALARAAGETAPILFVAAVFSGPTWPDGIRDNPVLALPYHIFVLAQDSFSVESQHQLWGAALVLVLLVFLFNFALLPLRLKELSR